MIRYKFIKGRENVIKANHQLSKKYKMVLTINHNIGSRTRYNVIYNLTHIFSTNDRSAIRMWLDLNGKKTVGKTYIFTDSLIKNDKNYCVIGLKNN